MLDDCAAIDPGDESFARQHGEPRVETAGLHQPVPAVKRCGHRNEALSVQPHPAAVRQTPHLKQSFRPIVDLIVVAIDKVKIRLLLEPTTGLLQRVRVQYVAAGKPAEHIAVRLCKSCIQPFADADRSPWQTQQRQTLPVCLRQRLHTSVIPDIYNDIFVMIVRLPNYAKQRLFCMAFLSSAYRHHRNFGSFHLVSSPAVIAPCFAK
ncbi:hypothetical protein D3C71_1490580 [compost metagenome]